jgi:hypothetical protein
MSDRGGGETYSVLAKSERHLLRIATNLDEDRTKVAKDLGNSHLKSLLAFGLKKAVTINTGQSID